MPGGRRPRLPAIPYARAAPPPREWPVLHFGVEVGEEVAKMVNSGQFDGGRSWIPELSFLWLTSYGSNEYNNALISDATWNRFQNVWNDIGTGKVSAVSVIEQ